MTKHITYLTREKECCHGPQSRYMPLICWQCNRKISQQQDRSRFCESMGEQRSSRCWSGTYHTNNYYINPRKRRSAILLWLVTLHTFLTNPYYSNLGFLQVSFVLYAGSYIFTSAFNPKLIIKWAGFSFIFSQSHLYYSCLETQLGIQIVSKRCLEFRPVNKKL